MKVYQDGKEVKGAEVIYDTAGNVDTVRVDGVHYAANAFELKDGSAKKVTKPAEKQAKKSGKVNKLFSASRKASPNSEVLSTEDLNGTNQVK